MKPQYRKTARLIAEQIAKVDKAYSLDLQFGGDGDSGEYLVDFMAKVLKKEREKIVQLLSYRGTNE